VGGVAVVTARHEVLARLCRRADEALRGTGGLVVVTGEGGIGKTTALAAVAAHVRGRAQVRWGAGVPGAPGYWPWREALRGFDAAAQLAADASAEGADTFRLFEDVTAAVLDAGEPVVLLLDDLHWADPASIRLLEFLTRRLVAAPVLVVAASRDPDLTTGATAVPLAGLSPDEVGELLAATLGAAVPPDEVARLMRMTGGNPFFVRQLALLWPDVGAVPAGIAAVLERRLASLPAVAAGLLGVASVFPGPIPAAAIDGRHGLAEVLRAGVLTGSGTYAFCHDLFRTYCYERLDPDTRAAHHDAVAALPGAPADTAYHLLRGVRPAAAVPYLRSGAEDATRRMAYDEAVGHRERILALEPPRAPSVLELAEAYRRAGALTDAGAAFARAADLASDPEEYGAAVLGIHALHAQTVRQSPDELTGLLRAALDRGPSAPIRARLTAALARVQAWSGIGLAEARSLADGAVSLARQHADRAVLEECLEAQHNVIWGPGTARERLAIAAELDDGLLLRASDLLELGDPAFRPVLHSFITDAEATRQPRLRYAALLRRAMLAAFDGLPDAAEQIEQAYRYGVQIGQRDAADARLAQLWPLVGASRRTSLAADVELVFPRSDEPAGRVHRILLRLAAGDADGARALAAPLSGGDLDSVPRNAGWLVAMALLTDIAAGVADIPLAEQVYERLVPFAGAVIVTGAAVATLGPVEQYLGRLAALLGRTADARAHLSRAEAQYVALGVPARVAGVPARLPAHAPVDGVFHRDGGRWTVGIGGTSVRLRHAKGLADLATLLAAPGRPVAAVDLAAATAGEEVRTALGFGSDPVLDPRARRELRARLRDLGDSERDAVLDGLRRQYRPRRAGAAAG
jgi:tetratricopeptide (TPR) repeat protein